MDRRNFLHLLGIGSMAATPVARSLASPPALTQSQEHHWTWTRLKPEETTAEVHQRFKEFRAAGVNSVILPSPDAETYALAQEEGLDLHTWWWVLCRRDKVIMEEHPEWYVVSREGNSTHDTPPYVPYYRFLCPTRTEVRSYLRERLQETLELGRVAGVCLDYIRYPDVILPRALWEKYDLVQDEELPPFDFCYCEVCRELFRAQEGIDPLELPDPTTNGAWRRFRWDSITRLVNELAEVVHRRKLVISASVFPSPSIARRLVRQDWATWNLDAVLPMVYHSFYDEPIAWIEPTVAEGVANIPPNRPLYAALYLPALKNDGDFEEAVARARAGGAKGIAMFGGVRKIPTL